MTIDIDAAATEAGTRLPRGGRVLAVGWATVDLERAAGSFGLDVRPAPASAVLGARCGTALTVGGTVVVLLEPATEGRLAAWLARHGEGLVAVWFSTDDSTGFRTGPPTDGPFGAERRLLGGASDAWDMFLLERLPATING